MKEKLQKVLARAGLGSRREIEDWIRAGLVKVNGQVVDVGERVGLRDRIQVRGRLLKSEELLPPLTQILLYHKPEGELVTRSDEQGRETVFARLPKPLGGRWIAIGRLDINTIGLLLLTNNGELARRLMHPSFEVTREYLVRVFGELSDDLRKKLLSGVTLDDGEARFDALEPMITDEPTESLNRWYKVTLREGRNREVRRLWEQVGMQVSRLKRSAFGPVVLPKSLRQGQSQLATAAQVNALLTLVDLPEQKADIPQGSRGQPGRTGQSKTHRYREQERSRTPKPRTTQPGRRDLREEDDRPQRRRQESDRGEQRQRFDSEGSRRRQEGGRPDQRSNRRSERPFTDDQQRRGPSPQRRVSHVVQEGRISERPVLRRKRDDLSE